jgi:hypothetical protein
MIQKTSLGIEFLIFVADILTVATNLPCGFAANKNFALFFPHCFSYDTL